MNDDWQAQYEFWHKFISDEVARLRFIGGYEPLDCELYPIGDSWIGLCKVATIPFSVRACPGYDSDGKRILRLAVRRVKS